jgi:hypothetical protein
MGGPILFFMNELEKILNETHRFLMDKTIQLQHISDTFYREYPFLNYSNTLRSNVEDIQRQLEIIQHIKENSKENQTKQNIKVESDANSGMKKKESLMLMANNAVTSSSPIPHTFLFENKLNVSADIEIEGSKQGSTTLNAYKTNFKNLMVCFFQGLINYPSIVDFTTRQLEFAALRDIQIIASDSSFKYLASHMDFNLIYNTILVKEKHCVKGSKSYYNSFLSYLKNARHSDSEVLIRDRRAYAHLLDLLVLKLKHPCFLFCTNLIVPIANRTISQEAFEELWNLFSANASFLSVMTKLDDLGNSILNHVLYGFKLECKHVDINPAMLNDALSVVKIYKNDPKKTERKPRVTLSKLEAQEKLTRDKLKKIKQQKRLLNQDALPSNKG